MDTEKTDKKTAILDAAEALFAEAGFDASSTRSIAAKAGVNMAMLSYYFGSKDGLYKAVLERGLGLNEDTFQIANDQDNSWQQLFNCVEFHAENVLSDHYFQKLIHHEVSLLQRSDVTDYITDNITRSANELKQIIVRGIENGSFRSADIELTLASIFGTLYYIVNSSHIASRVLNKDLKNWQVIQEELKPRVKKHLRDLLNAHLKLTNDK